MRLSIVLPVYGVEKYIEKCAVSLFTQKNSDDVEFIFVNDATKDNSIVILKNVIQEYDTVKNKVHIIDHENNKGLAAARLTGLLAAKGEYIWFVDSDDWVEPNSIETIIKSLVESPDVLYFNYYRNSKYDQKTNVDKYYPTLLNCLCLRFTLCVWRMVVRRDVYIKNNCLPIPGIDMSEDLVLHSRIRYYFSKVKVINVPLYHYRIDNENSYVNNVGEKQIAQIVEGLHKVYTFYKANLFSSNIKKCIAYRVLVVQTMKTPPNVAECHTLDNILKDSSMFLYLLSKFLMNNKTMYFWMAQIFRKVLIPCK